MKRGLFLVLLIAAVGRWSAAGESAEGQWLLLEQLPDGAAGLHYLPERRYPAGSRIVRVDSGRPGAAPRRLHLAP